MAGCKGRLHPFHFMLYKRPVWALSPERERGIDFESKISDLVTERDWKFALRPDMWSLISFIVDFLFRPLQSYCCKTGNIPWSHSKT